VNRLTGVPFAQIEDPKLAQVEIPGREFSSGRILFRNGLEQAGIYRLLLDAVAVLAIEFLEWAEIIRYHFHSSLNTYLIPVELPKV
jgi:hypothetical protein